MLTLGVVILCAVIFLFYLRALKARLKEQGETIRKPTNVLYGNHDFIKQQL